MTAPAIQPSGPGVVISTPFKSETVLFLDPFNANTVSRVVRRNLSSALIMEDDGDWDVRIRDQLQDFALSSHALTQPLASTSHGKYADTTYPKPPDTLLSSVPDLEFGRLPLTVAPVNSPYGDEWEVLWLGHCGMHFPFKDRNVVPKGRVVKFDQVCILNVLMHG